MFSDFALKRVFDILMSSVEIAVISSFFQLVFFLVVEFNQHIFSSKSDSVVGLTTAVFLGWLNVEVSLGK